MPPPTSTRPGSGQLRTEPHFGGRDAINHLLEGKLSPQYSRGGGPTSLEAYGRCHSNAFIGGGDAHDTIRLLAYATSCWNEDQANPHRLKDRPQSNVLINHQKLGSTRASTCTKWKWASRQRNGLPRGRAAIDAPHCAVRPAIGSVRVSR